MEEATTRGITFYAKDHTLQKVKELSRDPQSNTRDHTNKPPPMNHTHKKNENNGPHTRGEQGNLKEWREHH